MSYEGGMNATLESWVEHSERFGTQHDSLGFCTLKIPIGAHPIPYYYCLITQNNTADTLILQVVRL